MPRKKGSSKRKSATPRVSWFMGGTRPSGKGRKRRVHSGGGTIGKKKRKHGRR